MRVRSWRAALLAGVVSVGTAAGLVLAPGPVASAGVIWTAGPPSAAAQGVRPGLLAAYASYRHIPRADIARIRPGTLRLAGQAARRQWALAGFLPARHDLARVLAGFQDGASTAVFTRTGGGRWRLVRAGGESLGCPGVLPAWVQRAWRLTAAGCASAPARHRRGREVRPATPNPGTIAAVAEQNVGIGDTPASTDWNLDCDPYTTLVHVGVSTSGCGVDPHFNVQNENEEWCADFAKWVWEQGGVTADLGTLDPAAASFYTWGQQQGESMPADPSDPAVGDAVVFYPAGSPPNGSYADHVGIVAGVNSNGTVNLVNGDFMGSSNITVQANDNVSLGPWSAAVWGSGEQWIFVSPGQSAATGNNLLQNGSFESSGGGWQRLIPAGGVTNITRYDNAADAHDGSWYLAFNTIAAGGSIYQDVTVNAAAGASYTATAWLSSQSGTATGRLCVWGLASPGTDNCQNYRVTAGTYKQVQVVYDLPAGYSTLRFQVYPTVNGGTTDMDTASLTRNLLANGSFENSGGGWNRLIPAGGGTNITRYGNAADAHDGSWYLAFNTNAAGGSIYQDVTVNAGAGASYVATAWLSSQSGTATGRFCVWGLASPGTDNCQNYSVTAGTYKQVQVVYDLPAGYSTLRFQVYPTVNGGTTNLDTASLG